MFSAFRPNIAKVVSSI